MPVLNTGLIHTVPNKALLYTLAIPGFKNLPPDLNGEVLTKNAVVCLFFFCFVFYYLMCILQKYTLDIFCIATW